MAVKSPGARLEEILDEDRVVELSDTEQDEEWEDEAYSEEEEIRVHEMADPQPVPQLHSSLPPIVDELETQSSVLQEQTIKECLPWLTGIAEPGREFNEHGVPRLEREKHIAFLHQSLGRLPAPFVAIDASRPWFFYWALLGLSLLGEDVTQYRDRLIYSLRPLQNKSGGFGGGHGQISHLAGTYAAFLSLAIVGGEEALELIDRRAMWHWFGSLKQLDGGFQLCEGGEEDIRGAYCLMVMHSLLNLPMELPPDAPAKVRGDETFLTGLAEWIARCQTFEGGISAAPNNEGHGAYAFCALGTLCIMGQPKNTIAQTLNLPSLISWLSARQYAPEGGFSGRTNKLVDGCYSHWVGGCWALIEAALNEPGVTHADNGLSLWSRDGLIRYILGCCQSSRGGLRDKPSKPPDGYHSCYILAGLSEAQHFYYYEDYKNPAPHASLDAAFGWHASEAVVDSSTTYDEEDVVGLVHPVYVVPWGVAEKTRQYYEDKSGFVK